MTAARDDLIKDRGKYVMVPVQKSKICKDSEPNLGFKCQLEKGHSGHHKFWKESPLIGWKQ